MRNSIKICFILGLLLFFYCYCWHVYDDDIWQPYQVGDSIEFINNNGEIFKRGISSVRNRNNPSDPLLILNHRIYSTFVGTIKDIDAIVDITSEEGIKTIYFEPPFRRGFIQVIENEPNQKNLLPIRYNNLDLYKITPHEKDLRIEPYQDSIYWSHLFGYIKVFRYVVNFD